MKKQFTVIALVLVMTSAFADRLFAFSAPEGGIPQDTNKVISLDLAAYDSRLTDPAQTVHEAERALAMAQRLDFINGIGESYRIMGLGNYYLNQPEKSIDNYLNALAEFSKSHNLRSEAKVYNNIGNLYLDNDYEQSLEFLQKSLVIAEKLADKNLMASLYLNIGNVYYRENSFYQALNYYDKSNALLTVTRDSVNLIRCLQNRGVIYYHLKDYGTAQKLLIQASEEAKVKDLNEPVASIDLTLALVYMEESKFDEAEKIVQEGIARSEIIKDEKLASDFKYTSYQLELKRKNYQGAVSSLYDIYHKDSTAFKQNISNQIKMIREHANQQAKQKEYEIIRQRQAYDLVKFWGVTIVAGLLLVLVALLISNVKRKAKTNLQLTNLNAEVSRQKDNLDRINHHLEEIIDERTKDLQVKNKKLSEYSSYLSHQIRGPIATLKGLLNLEKEGLVDQRECIRMMNKSVSEIDDKIIEMSDMLHDPGRTGF